ncbi:hypothetical protein [Nostoc sp.]|uniref:hypothetical protein n=1 Tax=Nostoc sp. TaxID=1180 RepID=UPI002FF5B91F
MLNAVVGAASRREASRDAQYKCPIQLLESLRPKRSYAAGFTTPAPSSVPLRGSKLGVASRREVEMLNTSAQCPNKITYAP